MDRNARIYIAGHRGLIGSALTRALANYPNVITATHQTLELADAKAVDAFFAKEEPDYVFLAAGRVGGILENQRIPADFLQDNLAIQSNVLRAAHAHGVQKLILFGSSCMYPREASQPMAESALLTGMPEPTSLAYATAKLAGVQLCLAYNKQYGAVKFIPVIPNSAYGPNDNFNPGAGHVLSALTHRLHEAKLAHAPSIALWGSGTPRREFIHADDIARACMQLVGMELAPEQLPINIGVGRDYSIRELAEALAKVIGYTGKLEWDTSKPDGAPQKLLDSARLQALGWRPSISFEDGLKSTYAWYLENIATKAAA